MITLVYVGLIKKWKKHYLFYLLLLFIFLKLMIMIKVNVEIVHRWLPDSNQDD